MNYNIKDVSQRLKSAREVMELTPEFMAAAASVSVDEYMTCENGEKDFSLSFLNSCAEALGIEMIELLTGVTPTLEKYSVVRAGKGLPIERRIGFTYQHIAYLFRHKKIEPLVVTAPFSEDDHKKPIHLSVHEGQEMDFILSGSLKVIIGDHTEILNEGDCIYYDSSNPHGMIAHGGSDCRFLAILI